MRLWSRKDEVHQLYKPFFSTDLYYPRPRFADPLYQKFYLGYPEARPKGSKEEKLQSLLRLFYAQLKQNKPSVILYEFSLYFLEL